MRAATVTGKLLAPEEWSADADGLLVPTVRARRTRIVRRGSDLVSAGDVGPRG
ncbi:MAG TPA: hypothetical protein VNT32_03840 [Thermoleophilaceae bacterium]|nr:hypothetical protein [Thermoleophilaceae bacterium]